MLRVQSQGQMIFESMTRRLDSDGLPWVGENPEVFCFREVRSPNGSWICQMKFYEGFDVVAFLHNSHGKAA